MLPQLMIAIKDFNQILKAFKINATCVNFGQQGNYFHYDLTMGANGRVKDFQKFSDEISLALKASGKPRIKIMSTEGIVRLEFATPRKGSLKLFDYFTNKAVPFGELTCLLGQGVDGNKVWMDLAQNPHMIIAGTTGSGKSILLHNIIANLLNYNDVNITLIDPKSVEFYPYNNKFENIKVLHSYNESLLKIQDMIEVMEARYLLMKNGYNSTSFKKIVIIIDEFSDLIMQDQDYVFYTALCRLAQKCRAAKMHIVLATQRPSVNIIDGTIKANFPARIACRVASHVDSKVILDASGAEHLIGKGDAMIRDSVRNLERFQIAYTDATEVCSMFGV